MAFTITNCTFSNITGSGLTISAYNGPREQRKLDKWLDWFVWCEANCANEYELERPLIGEELPRPTFDDQANAVAFKLIFGGAIT